MATAPHAPPGTPKHNELLRTLRNACWLALLVFCASLFGIYTRPLGFLAAVWPANALLLGVLVRYPHMGTAYGWAGAIIGYIAADLLQGGSLLMTLGLTSGNLVFVATGLLLYRRMNDTHRRVQHPLSVLYLFGVCIAGALAASSWVALAGQVFMPTLFETGLWSMLGYWFTAELVNGILILPLVLTAQRIGPARADRRREYRSRTWYVQAVAPAVSVLFALGGSIVIGGPGAIAFCVPALLWCALVYPVFPTVLLTFIASILLMIAASLGMFSHAMIGTTFIDSTVSLRLGVALMALGPITVAAVNQVRNDLVHRLRHSVDHDTLTSALSRSAFFRRGRQAVDRAPAGEPIVVLMIDIDHFKQVNDENGHAAGDAVLVAFADIVRQTLRKNDLFGRLGGEEFGVILPGVGPATAKAMAERLRQAIAHAPLTCSGGSMPLPITASIGMACGAAGPATSVDALLTLADAALYQAKNAGRNRVTAALPA